MSRIEIFSDMRCMKTYKLMSMLDRSGIEYKHYDIDTVEGSMEASYRGVLWDFTPIVYIDGKRHSSTEPIILFDDIEDAISVLRT